MEITQISASSIRWPRLFCKAISLGCIAVPVLVLIYDIQTISSNLDFNPAVHTVSEFALRNNGPLERASMVLASLLLVLLSVVWKVRLAPIFGSLFNTGSRLLLLVGISFLITAVFCTDLHGAPKTLHGTIHIAAAMTASAAFPVFLLLTFRALKEQGLFSKIRRATLVTGIAGIITVIWVTWAYIGGGVPGLAERTMMVLYLSWLATVGYRLTEYAADAAPPS